MTVTQVPFFLSSASGLRPNAGGTKFTVECSPACSIPSDATSCTLHVHSASVPYTWNNVDATNNSFVVTCPGLTAVTLQVAEGAHTMSSLQDAVNHAVCSKLHLEGAALLQDGSGVDNFITLTPDYVANRVVLTFNHDACTLHWSNAASTLGAVIGFSTDIQRSDSPTVDLSALTEVARQFVVVSSDGGQATVTIGAQVWTEAALIANINYSVQSSMGVSNFISAFNLVESTHQPGTFTASYTLGDAASANFQQVPFTLVGAQAPSARYAALWTHATGLAAKHTATAAAKLDKINEVGISVLGMGSHVGYDTGGTQGDATLARFQVSVPPGSLMAFAPSEPIRCDVSSLIAGRIGRFDVLLVDQNGDLVPTLKGEEWSALLILEYTIE
jgi:hypothetical protein